MRHAFTQELSSNIDYIDLTDDGLVVTFRHGGSYLYEGAGKPVFESMIAADSPGKFVHSTLKPGFVARKLVAVAP